MSTARKERSFNRNLLIDPFQLRLAGVAICHFLLVVLIIELQSGDITSPHVQAAARKFLFLHNNLWMPLLGALILLVLHNIIISHRIAGPLFRFRRYLKGVGDGDLSTPIGFRKKDYLKKEADVANEMVESLRGKVTCVKKQLEQVSWTWTEMRSALAEGAPHDLQLKIDAMDDHIEECMASLQAFETGHRNMPATEDLHAPSAQRQVETSEEPVEIEV
jgi:methyl-accepting chemotaxis protein